MKLSTLLLSSLLMISMACNERKEAKTIAPKWEYIHLGDLDGLYINTNQINLSLRIGDTIVGVYKNGGAIAFKLFQSEIITGAGETLDTLSLGTVVMSKNKIKPTAKFTGGGNAKSVPPLKFILGDSLLKPLPGDLYAGDNGTVYVIDDSGRSILIKGGKPASPVTFKIDSTWRRVPPEEPYHPIIKKIIYPDSSWIPIKSQKTSKYGYKTVDSLIGYTDATIIIYKGEGGKRMADTIYRSSGIGITLDSVGVILKKEGAIKP